MIFDVVVVGGGLSGLVAALELSKKGLRVAVYEASSELGGFAKTSGKNQEFDEHSWRSYGDCDTNLRRLVEDDLELDWPTKPVNLTPFPPVPTRMLSKGHWRMAWTLLRGIVTWNLTGLHRQSWYDEVVVPDFGGSGALLALPGIYKSGSDYRAIPVATMVRVVERCLFRKSSAFRIASLPTQEYLIAPLKSKLDHLGVVFFLKTPVNTLDPMALSATRVISAIPPAAYRYLDRRGLSCSALTAMVKLADTTRYQQVSFRIFFKRCLRYPNPNHPPLTFDLHQSPWGLVIVPCDAYLSGSYWSTSVWSGTCTVMDQPDRHGRTPLESSLQECQESILEQVVGCGALVDYFREEGVELSEEVSSIRLWKGWCQGPDGKLHGAETMSVHSFREMSPRPVAGSLLGPNIYLAGAHAGTGCGMWLMESATEAGKRAALAILQDLGVETSDVWVDTHERHPFRVGLAVVALTAVIVGVLRGLAQG